VRGLAHAYVQREWTRMEPMPEWDTVDLAKLQSALAGPSESFGGQELYPEFADKLAVLLYRMAKNHAWANGNKRMATISTFLFAALNRYGWDANNDDVYIHVTFIAASESGVQRRSACVFLQVPSSEAPTPTVRDRPVGSSRG
jgi:death-on-curing family protein